MPVTAEFSFSESTVGFIMNGVMNAEAIENLSALIVEKFKEFDAIDLYLEDSGIEKFSFYSVVYAVLFPFEHAHQLRKIAMVTDRKWIHSLAAINNLFIASEIKNFTSQERLEAILWIAEG